MTIDKIKEFEPLFDSWYVDGKISQGRNMDIFKVYRNFASENEYMALKTIKFPRSDKELSAVIDSGKFKTIDEYLDTLEKMVRENMDKMMNFRTCSNIVRFDNYTIIKERSCFYVVMLMELVTPLTDYIKGYNINVREVCKISTDLCKALSVFRQFGLIHQEVKHENIYVNSKGQYLLGDFGITTLLDSEFEVKEESTYTAPEFYNKNETDTCSDVYSLGILMYKFLNKNRVPFLPEFPAPISLADRQAAFQRRISGEIMPAPSEADPRLSAIILKACSFNVSQRYQSPQELKSEITDYVNFINMYGTSTKPQVAPTAPIPINRVPAKAKPAAAPVPNAQQKALDKVVQEQDSPADNKKAYALIICLTAVLVMIVAFLFNGSSDDIDMDTTDAAIEVTINDTTTTTTTTQAATETTTQTTTETTTQTTTETTAATTVQATEPVLADSIFDVGDTAYNGKSYYEFSDYSITVSQSDGQISKIELVFNDSFGTNIKMNDGAYVYQVNADGSVENTVAALVSTKIDYGVSRFGLLSQIADSLGLPSQTMTCTIEVDSDSFVYDTSAYDYYLVFEQGAFESDDYISLPIQIQLD